MITVFLYITLLTLGGFVYYRLRMEKNSEDEHISELFALHQQLERSVKEEELAAIQYKRAMISEAAYYSQMHDEKLGLTVVQAKVRPSRLSQPIHTGKRSKGNMIQGSLYMRKKDKIA